MPLGHSTGYGPDDVPRWLGHGSAWIGLDGDWIALFRHAMKMVDDVRATTIAT